MCKLHGSLMLAAIVLLAGCRDLGTPRAVTEPGLEDLVIANCYIVQQAAETFASENGGIYPLDIGYDQSAACNTLIQLLPQHTFLVNPATDRATQPVDGAADSPGETAYYVRIDSTGVAAGYTITGFGTDMVVITLVK